MKIIDAHLHATFEGKSHELYDFIKKNKIDYTFEGFKNELSKNKVVGAITISESYESATPIEMDPLVAQAKKDKRLFPVCAVNPDKTSKLGFEKLRKALKSKQVYGIKIFLGYYPYYAMDKKYLKFYKLAAECDCPVIFHTGDTFGSKYLVKYAHPLQLDEVAVKFTKTRFVMAHVGYPWIRSAAEVIYKNPNMFADVSALCVGPIGDWSKYLRQDLDWLYNYVGDSSKFLYGTDWPLVSMQEYLKIMKTVIPKQDHKKFFFENAKKVFRLPL